MSNGTKFIIFLSGAVVGSLATWCLAKGKYKQIADEEIMSVKAFYKKQAEALATTEIVKNYASFVDAVTKGNIPVCNEICEKMGRIQDVINNIDTVKSIAETAKAKPDLVNYNGRYQSIVKENAYNQSTESYPENDMKGEKSMIPYVITPEEFGQNDEYDIISLTYYSDGVLTDENDEIIENQEAMVGHGSLSRFGEYENDMVYVRNDTIACDYEITRDEATYSSIYSFPDSEET